MNTFGVFKKQIFGLNVTGPQGVNANNEFTIGQIGGDGNTPLTSEYWYQPAIRLGNKIFTPVGNVIMENNDEDFIPELTLPTPPADGEDKNFILWCDWNSGEFSWREFPNLPEDFDEKNYVLALNDEGTMIWKEEIAAPATVGVVFSGDTSDMSVTVNGTPISVLDKFANGVTLWFKAGDVLNATGNDGSVSGSVNGPIGEGTAMTFPYTISGEEFYIEINDNK